MKSLKDNIRGVLKSRLNVSYRIVVKEPNQEYMNKKIFIEVVDQLKKVDERRDFLLDEIGMDMTAYEDQFFAIIENLFKLCFTSGQLDIIQLYLYRMDVDEDWDGTITIEVGKEERKVPFKSATDVWEVITKLRK
tara:strand:- start:4 stop:408 length:405 start_codon:yes stop_codon:yes gene_type:complete